MVFVKILVLIASVFACMAVIKYRLQMVQTFGKAYYAEKYLGNGGSYTMWILIGVLMVFMAAVWLVGTPCDRKIDNSQQVDISQDY
jgi:hypothetical protein